MNDETHQPPRTHSVRLGELALTAASLAALADFLFWGRPVGWTIGLYGTALLAALFVFERRLPRSVPEWILTGALLGLLGYSLEQPGVPMLIIGGLGLLALGLTMRQGWTTNSVRWAWRCGAFMVAGWLSVFRDARAAGGQDATRKGAKRAIRWLLPIGLTGMFLALLSLANPILSNWVTSGWERIHSTLDSLPAPARILMWLAVAVGVWALLRFQCKETETTGAAGEIEGILQRIPAGFVIRCLVLFNALFAIQTVLDLFYLWAGATLPEGLTYAEYAHRGSYPLVATALLAAAFALVTFARKSPSRGSWSARGLVYLWLAQNVFLVISAGRRLSLYVDFFGLSRWRMAAGIWMFLVALGIGYICLRILLNKDNLWLTNVNVVTAVVVLYGCCFINFDGIIAWHNVRHCHELQGKGAWLDVGYLRRLGPESLPALRWGKAQIQNGQKGEKISRAIADLELKLRHRLSNWRGWTWRRERLNPK
jgi:hypothetical protein